VTHTFSLKPRDDSGISSIEGVSSYTAIILPHPESEIYQTCCQVGAAYTYKDSKDGAVQVNCGGSFVSNLAFSETFTVSQAGISTVLPSLEVMSYGEYNRKHGGMIMEWMIFATFAAGLVGIPALMERKITNEDAKAEKALKGH